MSEENSKKAAIIMELTKRWFCYEHSRTCFVDVTRHIQLTPYHLTSWSNAIVSKLLIIKLNQIITNYY